jgi:RNA polymerase sigma factor (sigma-70 family)
MQVDTMLAPGDGGTGETPVVCVRPLWPGANRSRVVPSVQAVAVRDIRSLFDAHYTSMVRLATVMLGHNAAAEDVVQQAFVALDRRLSSLTPGAEAAYLRTSVMNGCRSHVRAGRAQKRQLVMVREGTPPAPEEEAIRDDQHRQVLAAIDQLPERQRQCVVLRYYLGLSDREVAETLGLALGSAKTHLRRGQQALAEKLGELR